MTIYFLFALLIFAVLAALLAPLWQAGKKREAITIAAVFIASAFGLYAWTGAPQILPLMEARNEKLTALKASMVQNSDAVKRNPSDAKAWIELGQDFIETSQYEAAANAFKQAVKLSNGDPRLILAYARALVLEDGGKVSDRARKSFEMVLLQDPENAEARYWLIVWKLQNGDTKNAMQEMKTLYHSLPEGSPLKEMIDRQIGRGN